jgi:hypothetical protein
MKWLLDDTTAWELLSGALKDPAGRKGLLGLTLILGLFVWLLGLGAMGVVHWWEVRQLPPPATGTTLAAVPMPPVSPSTSYETAAEEVGLNAEAYARSARSHGLEPAEALSADLIVCAVNADCPGGVTQSVARASICQRTGKMC